MTTKLWKKFIEGKFLFNLYFPFLQVLNREETLILCELLAEYNYACENNLNIYDNFLVDFKRISERLFIGTDVFLNAINNFQEMGLLRVCTPVNEDLLIVWIKEDNIIFFMEHCKNEYMPHEWDWELTSTQNPKIQNISFGKTISKLIDLVNDNYKESEKIPTVIYVYCSLIAQYFNLDEINFMENDTAKNFICACINNSEFKPAGLPHILKLSCEKLLS